MKEHRRKVAEILNRSDIIAHVSMTGGGTSFIGEYLGFGGASSTLVGAEVPYHPSKVDEFLGNKPFDKYCSRGTARQMAAKSYFIAKGSEMNREESNPIGIGVTCSLTTGKGERVGRENKAFVCDLRCEYRRCGNQNSTTQRNRREFDESSAVWKMVWKS